MITAKDGGLKMTQMFLSFYHTPFVAGYTYSSGQASSLILRRKDNEDTRGKA